MLDLSGNKFVGKIPEFSKSNSTQSPQPEAFEFLNLANNFLTGSIPSWIHSLEFLTILRLDDNNLTGTIKVFHSKSLPDLSLSSNNLNGEIPNSIFKQEELQSLDLSYNNLDGVVELSKFSLLKNLDQLILSFNNFMIVRSNKVFNHNPFPQLEYLSLAPCNIRALSDILKNMKSLDRLYVSHNKIQGRIPKWLCDYRTSSLSNLNISHNFLTHVERVPCKNLQSLDLRSNMIQEHLPIVPPSLVVLFISNNNLFGEIPSTYCNLNLHMNNFSREIPQDMFKNLTGLRSLHFSGNHLEGSLPRSLRNSQSLEVLDVGNNMIYDTFPHYLEELPMLQVLVLKSNKFHGSIEEPKVKNSFQKLQIMDLSNNEFIGLLPTKYFESFTTMMDGHATRNLTHIGENYYQDSVNSVVKDLSLNKLVGEIPSKMMDLTQLLLLNLSHNKLVGPISRGNQFNTFHEDSYSGNVELCGPPLSKSCNNGMQQDGDHGEKYTDHIIFDWKIVMIGYGCGLIIGISVGYMVLYSERFDYWLYKKVQGCRGVYGVCGAVRSVATVCRFIDAHPYKDDKDKDYVVKQIFV
ncbi:receptor-like protein 33 [Humulus lupulus]|uniref:receptor-like protein 33 n=1 Tax=Humulus lupulus TaxID=3486 RepID=UPI002B40E139|nr:receptor-like protein 33 [Humulus lupulus]